MGVYDNYDFQLSCMNAILILFQMTLSGRLSFEIQSLNILRRYDSRMSKLKPFAINLKFRLPSPSLLQRIRTNVICSSLLMATVYSHVNGRVNDLRLIDVNEFPDRKVLV